MKLLYFSVFFLFPSFIYAQCCSTGSPAGASTYIGILKKQNLRITGFYRYSYFDTYYRESSPDNSFKILKNTFYNFTGTSVAFGLTHKVTIENEAGFFINKTQVYNTNPEIIRNTTGFSNGTLSLKYGFIYNEASEFELTGGIGIKYPFSLDTVFYDNNVQLPRELHLSQGAFGAVGHLFISKTFSSQQLIFLFINRYDYNFPDRSSYKSGMLLMNSFFAGKIFKKKFITLLQIRSEWRGVDVEKNNDRIRNCFEFLF